MSTLENIASERPEEKEEKEEKENNDYYSYYMVNNNRIKNKNAKDGKQKRVPFKRYSLEEDN